MDRSAVLTVSQARHLLTILSMFDAKFSSLVLVLPSLLSASVYASQEPLSDSHRSHSTSSNDLNFTSLFAPSTFIDPKSGPVSPWSKADWNGLTTFAGTVPLRCFGGDEGALFDVAVLGTFE